MRNRFAQLDIHHSFVYEYVDWLSYYKYTLDHMIVYILIMRMIDSFIHSLFVENV